MLVIYLSGSALKKQKSLLNFTLNPNIILVALNISRGDIAEPFANFHDKIPSTDFKIKYAIKIFQYGVLI